MASRQRPQSGTRFRSVGLRRAKRRGVILFVVTIVIAMASLAAYGFVFTMQGENKAAHASADQLQVAQVAASGEEFMAAWLQASREARRLDTQMYGDALFAQPVTEPYQMEDATFAGHFHIVTEHMQADEFPAESFTLNDSTVARQPFRYGFVNESTKLHLQTLLAWDEQWPGSGRNALLQMPGMTESIADAILDWIDSDDTSREFGAESEYYLSLPRPYTPTNAVPASLEDLLRVRGVTHRLLTDGDRNVLPPIPNNVTAGSTQTLPFADEPHSPWQDFLTVHSAERNETFDGQSRINVNDEDLVSLHRTLTAELSTELAQFIILYRQYGPAAADDDESEIEQVTQVPLDLSKPASYQLASLAVLVNATVIVPSSADDVSGEDDDDDKKLFASPLSTGSASAGQIDEWLDRLTVRKEETIVGRLNVFAARPEILYGLPLPNPAIATQILAHGQQENNNRETISSNGETPGLSWLLAEGIVDIDEFRQLAPYLTTGGDVVRFQIMATHGKTRLYHRSEVVLDGTVKNTQRVYFRDLRRLGTPELFDMFNRNIAQLNQASIIPIQETKQ